MSSWTPEQASLIYEFCIVVAYVLVITCGIIIGGKIGE